MPPLYYTDAISEALREHKKLSPEERRALKAEAGDDDIKTSDLEDSDALEIDDPEID
jgi:hypothetical protein